MMARSSQDLAMRALLLLSLCSCCCGSGTKRLGYTWSSMKEVAERGWVRIDNELRLYDFELKVSNPTAEFAADPPAVNVNFRYSAGYWIGTLWKWTVSNDPTKPFQLSLKIRSEIETENVTQWLDSGCYTDAIFNIEPSKDSGTNNNTYWRFGKDSTMLYVLRNGELVANVSRDHGLSCLNDTQWGEMKGQHAKFTASSRTAGSAEDLLRVRKGCVIPDNGMIVDYETGAVVNFETSDLCVPCDPGFYLDPNSGCTACPADTYSLGGPDSTCISCPNGTTVAEGAGAGADSCQSEKTPETEPPESLLHPTKVEELSKIVIELNVTEGIQLGSDDVTKALDSMEELLEVSSQSEEGFRDVISSFSHINSAELDSVEDEVLDKMVEMSVIISSNMVRLPPNASNLVVHDSVGFGRAEQKEDKLVLALSGDPNDLAGSSSSVDNDTYFKAEMETPANMTATAVFYQSAKLFPSKTAADVQLTGSTEVEREEAYKDLAGVFVQEKEEKAKEVTVVASIISEINLVDKNTLEISNSKLDGDIELSFGVVNGAGKLHQYVGRKVAVHQKLVCKFYNTTGHDWSEEGCQTTSVFNPEKEIYDVTCRCSHLTSFAVLMSFTHESSVGEELASEILLGVSLVCLILTLIATLPVKHHIKNANVRINMMLVTALIFSIVCFFMMDLFVSSGVTATTPCTIVAFLLNYFWLSQLSWMIIEAFSMYWALVQVFGSENNHSLTKLCVVGWAAPILGPAVAIAWGQDDFADPKTCFVRAPYGLVSFYGPVVVGVVLIWALFFSVARVVLRATKIKCKAKHYSEAVRRRKQLQSALSVSTLLGLGWLVGFFLLMDNSNYSEINNILRWLFVLLNAPQGIFLFFFYVLLSRRLKAFWLYRLSCGKLGMSPTDIKRLTSTSSTAVSHSSERSVLVSETSSRGSRKKFDRTVSHPAGMGVGPAARRNMYERGVTSVALGRNKSVQ